MNNFCAIPQGKMHSWGDEQENVMLQGPEDWNWHCSRRPVRWKNHILNWATSDSLIKGIFLIILEFPLLSQQLRATKGTWLYLEVRAVVPALPTQRLCNAVSQKVSTSILPVHSGLRIPPPSCWLENNVFLTDNQRHCIYFQQWTRGIRMHAGWQDITEA